MSVQVARLAAGRTARNPVKSVNANIIGSIFTSSRPDITAVVKSLSPRQLANELLATSLLDRLELPSPQGFLVFAEDADSFDPHAIKHSSGLRIYFGSELSNYPVFYSFFKMEDTVALRALAGNDNWGWVLGFDEWTANKDRHLNNFLYDGANIYMFDHDQCFTGPSWCPPDFVPDKLYPCHPAVDAVHSIMPISRKQAAAKIASEIARRAEDLNLLEIFEDSLAGEVNHGIPDDLPAAMHFLKMRVPYIAKICGARLSLGGLV